MSASASFSSFHVRSPTSLEQPGTPRRVGGGRSLNSTIYADPMSPIAGSPRAGTPRAGTPRTGTPVRAAPFSPSGNYRSSAVYGNSAYVSTPVRRANSPSSSFRRNASGTPTTASRAPTPTYGSPVTPRPAPTMHSIHSSGYAYAGEPMQRTDSRTRRQSTPIQARPAPTADIHGGVLPRRGSAGNIIRNLAAEDDGSSTSYSAGGITDKSQTTASSGSSSAFRRLATPTRTNYENVKKYSSPHQEIGTGSPRTPGRFVNTLDLSGSNLGNDSFSASFTQQSSDFSRPMTPRRESPHLSARPVSSATSQASGRAVPPPEMVRHSTPVPNVPAPGSQPASPVAPDTPRGPTSSNGKALLQNFVDRWNNKYTENQNNYKEGGYMTVAPGNVLKERYVVLQKLGWGEFSTVWLAYDKQATVAKHSFVAVKIAKCNASVTQSTQYEINLLRFVHKAVHADVSLTHLLDSFDHTGQYGTHKCFVMAVHGSNMLCVIDQMKALRRKRGEREMQLVKSITASVLDALQQLDAINVIHTDLKPENVLCAAPDPKVTKIIQSFLSRNPRLATEERLNAFSPKGSNAVVLADFGLSVLLEPTQHAANCGVGSKKEFRVTSPGVVHNSTGTLIQTREYRAPEILFGADFCPRTDIWSLGCMVYELITGDFLVDPKRKTRDEREMDIEHVAMIMQILGPVPTRLTTAGRGGNAGRAPRYIHRYFNEQGHFLYMDRLKRYPRRSIAAELESFLEPAEAERAAQFIMSCFTYDPMERCTAADLLKHSWLRSSIPSASV